MLASSISPDWMSPPEAGLAEYAKVGMFSYLMACVDIVRQPCMVAGTGSPTARSSSAGSPERLSASSSCTSPRM